MQKLSYILMTLVLMSGLLGHVRADDDLRLPEPTAVKIMLDFTPNTNHTGIYVAQALGYYDDLNLNVEIIEPVDVLAEQAVSTGLVEFGIGFQEFSTFALVDGADIVSVAAIIQENTSGFAALSSQHSLNSPADLLGLTYGGFSVPTLENAMINTLVACDDAQWTGDEYQDIGYADAIELMALERVDFSWIFYAWQGIDAELRGDELDVLFLADYPDCVPAYYTPILLTSSSMIEAHPDVVRAFVHATAQGYQVAIDDPAEAAAILVEAVPELDADLVAASADWLSSRYQGDAEQWGLQEREIWETFTAFMVANEIIPADQVDIDAVFTNDFLPALDDE